MRTTPAPSPLGRLSADPAADNSPDADDGLVSSWVPDGRVRHRERWLSAVRADPGRAGGIALVVIAVLAVLVTLFTLMRQSPAPVVSAKLPPVEMVSSAAPPPGAGHGPTGQTTTGPGEPAVVSVVGLVHQPGLVTLAPGSRIADAVSAAGGALAGADLVGLNLAGRITDGEQIVVGVATPAGQPAVLGSSVSSMTATDSTTKAKTTGPLDLNAATVEQLDELPGVGPVTADAIVAWRTAHGKFTSVDQLGDVDGIGPARLEKLRTLVRV